jgi:hypothetical protein
MSNEAVEYVRGVPVVKTFGQTVFSFHRFKASIDDYCDFCMPITGSAPKRKSAPSSCQTPLADDKPSGKYPPYIWAKD